MSILAINGGEKIRKSLFPAYKFIDQNEIDAVTKVMKSGILSKFIGGWHEDFKGGYQIQSLEKEWAEKFKVKHAIAVNSATSGLIAAIGAIGISPGDEVIVSPYSMAISATAPLFYGAIPIFADIEEDYFCIDAKSIESKITNKTKAIIAVDLFGHPYNYKEINKIAEKHGLVVIEDASQAPGSKYDDKYAGTLGDVGVYSLNYHKHIHSGEGGIIVTNDDEIAKKLYLIRNHAESVVEGMEYTNLVNMVGFNFRMTELEATIARVQLGKLDDLVEERIKNVEYIAQNLSEIEFLEPAKNRKGVKNVFYKHIIKFDSEKAGVSRNVFFEAVKAELMPIELRETEGINISTGYVKPLYLLPLFKEKIAFGDKGYPFNSPYYNKEVNYDKGLCPICENMHYETLVSHEYMRPPMTKNDLDDFINAIKKVSENLEEIK